MTGDEEGDAGELAPKYLRFGERRCLVAVTAGLAEPPLLVPLPLPPLPSLLYRRGSDPAPELDDDPLAFDCPENADATCRIPPEG